MHILLNILTVNLVLYLAFVGIIIAGEAKKNLPAFCFASGCDVVHGIELYFWEVALTIFFIFASGPLKVFVKVQAGETSLE